MNTAPKKLTAFIPSKPSSTNPTFWARAGTARINDDGSISVQLDVIPLNGQLHLRASPPHQRLLFCQPIALA